MRLMSPILQRVVYPTLGKVGYFHSRALASASVVTYHGVLPQGYQSADPFLDNILVSIALFRSHLGLLKKHYEVISPDRFLRWLREPEDLPARAVLLTCDDGLLNNVATMLPILQEEELQCLFFVTGGSLGDSPEMLWYVELYLMLMEVQGEHRPVDWQGGLIPGIPADPKERRTCWLHLVKTLSRLDAERRLDFLREALGLWGLNRAWKQRYLDDPVLRQRFLLLRAPELKQLVGAGMTIGAHTMSHPVLTEQPAELARAEMTDCRQILQRCSGQPVWAIAYPFGDPASVGNREYQLAEAAGYECAFVNVGGSIGSAFSRFSVPRIHVTAEMSLPVYEAHVSGFHSSLQRRFRGPAVGS
jgi:peptidoglycan/xylan/chitin deacetylase (PgdA/CDA1 family)